MAKKRKKDKAEDEEYEFVPPEFDEKEFLKKELSDTRVAVLTVGYAALVGIVAGAISYVSSSAVGLAFLAGIAGIFSLKYFYTLMKVDTAKFQKKSWAGNVAMFFFTFLAIWVLLLNVPFMDNSKPTVDKVVVWVERDGLIAGIEYKYVEAQKAYGWVPKDATNWTLVVSSWTNATVNVTAKVADNGNLASVEIAVGSISAGYNPMDAVGDSRYETAVPGTSVTQASGLMFYIRASDEAGNQFTFNPVRPVPLTG